MRRERYDRVGIVRIVPRERYCGRVGIVSGHHERDRERDRG